MSAQPRSILHAAENIKGGVGTYLRDLLVMQRDSFGDGVVTAIVPESQRPIVQSPAGVEIVTFDDRGSRLLSAWRLAKRVRETLARMQPDVIHVHSTFAGAALRPLLWLMRLQAAVIYCAHGWAFDRRTSRASRKFAEVLERRLASFCDVVVCISDHELRAAARIGIPSVKLVRVSNGIPREAPAIVSEAGVIAANTGAIDWPPGKRRVLFVGRFDRQKGTDLLLKALSQLEDTTFAYLVGDAVLGDSRSAALPANVRATGWLSANELQAYYQSADVLVVPSRWEGFGLNAAEAMRAGLAVIASRVGGLAEVVEDGVTGVLIPPEDVGALLAALRDVSDDRLQAMGRAGRQRFLRHFTMDRVHRQLIDVYRRELAHRSAGLKDARHA